MPPISTIGFGLTVVSSLNRVPIPPARMTTFIGKILLTQHYGVPYINRSEKYYYPYL